MKARRLPLVLLGLVLFVSPALAKKKHHNDSTDSAGHAAPAPKVDPTALPSASLQPLLDAHLDRVLSPLGEPKFSQQEVVASLKVDYLAAMANAADNRKPMFAAAADVCNAVTAAITAREQAVYAWHGSSLTHSSEVMQPNGGRRVGKEERQGADAFFRRSVENDWAQQADALRRRVTTLALRERAMEQQVVSIPAPAPPTPPAQ